LLPAVQAPTPSAICNRRHRHPPPPPPLMTSSPQAEDPRRRRQHLVIVMFTILCYPISKQCHVSNTN
jgi:hypothetical protein